MDDTTHVQVFHHIAQLSGPNSGLRLRNALLSFYNAHETSAGGLFHYDVNSGVRFNRLLICTVYKNASSVTNN